MASVQETLQEIHDRAVQRWHPVLMCQHALQHHTNLTLDRPDSYRLAEELVDGAEEFFELLGRIPPAIRPPKLRILCSICGSQLCPTYGAPAMVANGTGTDQQLLQLFKNLVAKGGP